MRMKNKALFQLDKSVILDSVFVLEKWDRSQLDSDLNKLKTYEIIRGVYCLDIR